MKHIDLFSGIGGFALAVDTVWPGSEHIFCDNDNFCQQVLKKHWPNSTIYGDIRQFIADTGSKESRGVSGSEWETISKIGEVFILTGGFPCQPFSQAGRRKGTADDRYLWPEMFRVIQLTKPQWVIAENVRGLVTWNEGMVLEQVCADLEGEGYEVQPFIIPAVAKNAPHRRDRVWIVAFNAKYDGRNGSKDRQGDTERSNGDQTRQNQIEQSKRPDTQGSNAHNPVNKGLERHSDSNQEQGEWKGTPRPDAETDWERDWIEVATELCGVDDGLSAELDGLKLSKSAHRRERLKSLGNAIVPQVAIEIMKAIKENN